MVGKELETNKEISLERLETIKTELVDHDQAVEALRRDVEPYHPGRVRRIAANLAYLIPLIVFVAFGEVIDWGAGMDASGDGKPDGFVTDAFEIICFSSIFSACSALILSLPLYGLIFGNPYKPIEIERARVRDDLSDSYRRYRVELADTDDVTLELVSYLETELGHERSVHLSRSFSHDQEDEAEEMLIEMRALALEAEDAEIDRIDERRAYETKRQLAAEEARIARERELELNAEMRQRLQKLI